MAARSGAGTGLGDPGRLLLGTADALATQLAVDVAALRLTLLGLALAAPPLALLYVLLTPVALAAPRRPLPLLRGVGRDGAAGTLGLLALAAAAALLARRLGLTLPDAVAATVLLATAAVALLWRGIAGAGGWAWLTGATPGTTRRSGATVARVAVGGGVALAGLEILSRRPIGWHRLEASLTLLGPLGLVLAGAGLVVVPPLVRLGGELAGERRDRIRADERARLASHLHDSVLQTLVLVQRRADDATGVATLARRQERELRDWLYGETRADASGRLRDRLAGLAAEIEDRYEWRVELVTVGDRDVAEAEEALLAATREAVVNAARHSGAAVCDVYAECARTASRSSSATAAAASRRPPWPPTAAACRSP